MEQKKTTKYFKYAIGEIILVVIGILIALQINNWNEQRKASLFENKVLSEILTDTEEDLIEMSMALDELNVSEKSTTLLINHLTTNQPYHDSLDIHFANALSLWSLSPNNTAFEMAKSEGLYFIKNDSIRFLASKANEYYLDYVKVLESRFQDYKASIVFPYTLSRFDSYNFQAMKPTSYETLKNDTTYTGILKTLSSMRMRYSNHLEKRNKLLISLKEMIKTELK